MFDSLDDFQFPEDSKNLLNKIKQNFLKGVNDTTTEGDILQAINITNTILAQIAIDRESKESTQNGEPIHKLLGAVGPLSNIMYQNDVKFVTKIDTLIFTSMDHITHNVGVVENASSSGFSKVLLYNHFLSTFNTEIMEFPTPLELSNSQALKWVFGGAGCYYTNATIELYCFMIGRRYAV